MTEQPDWLDKQTVQSIAALFREHGVYEVCVIPTIGQDEAIFLVDSASAAKMREAALTAALMNRLGRKVWITTDASAWHETPIRIAAIDDGAAR